MTKRLFAIVYDIVPKSQEAKKSFGRRYSLELRASHDDLEKETARTLKCWEHDDNENIFRIGFKEFPEGTDLGEYAKELNKKYPCSASTAMSEEATRLLYREGERQNARKLLLEEGFILD